MRRPHRWQYQSRLSSDGCPVEDHYAPAPCANGCGIVHFVRMRPRTRGHGEVPELVYQLPDGSEIAKPIGGPGHVPPCEPREQ